MPDPRQQNHRLGEGGLMFGKDITVFDEVLSAENFRVIASSM